MTLLRPWIVLLGATAALTWTALASAETAVSKDLMLDPTAMDVSADPCKDFYRFSCGAWLDRTTMPGDQSRWGRGFSTVAEQNSATLKDVLEAYSRGDYSVQTPYAAKLGTYYASCMNEAAIERET